MRLGLGSFADDHNKALQEPVAGYKARSVNDSSEVKFARDVDAVMFYITRDPSPPPSTSLGSWPTRTTHQLFPLWVPRFLS